MLRIHSFLNQLGELLFCHLISKMATKNGPCNGTTSLVVPLAFSALISSYFIHRLLAYFHQNL